MQRVITIRASQSDLDLLLSELALLKVRVVSVTRGSEWGRVGFSYKWTVVLEADKLYEAQMEQIDKVVKSYTKKSYWITAVLAIGLLVGIGLIGALCASLL